MINFKPFKSTYLILFLLLNFQLISCAQKTQSQDSKFQVQDADKEDEKNFLEVLNQLQDCDFVVCDTPGSDSYLSRLAHSYADTVITPINDSFIDLDLIGNVKAETLDSIKPGIYSAMLWEQKMKKIARTKKEMNWVVVRNRLSSLDAINKRNMEFSIEKLAKRFGFKVAPGFGDRVIFKELFLLGLTLHDAPNTDLIRMSSSVIAARQELREFVKSLGIKEVLEKISNSNNSDSTKAVANG
jgi:chromosome partitioning protein